MYSQATVRERWFAYCRVLIFQAVLVAKATLKRRLWQHSAPNHEDSRQRRAPCWLLERESP